MKGRNFALIFAAEPRWRYLERGFDRPRGLIPLDGETVMERLLRQCRERNVYPIVAIARAGYDEIGWNEEHVEAFRRLPCAVVTSPHTREEPAGTVWFLLRELLENAERYGASPESKIITIFADYIYTEQLMDRMVNYPAPCVYRNKLRGWSLILNFRLLPTILKLGEKHIRQRFLAERNWPALEKLGFVKCGSANNHPPVRNWCVELDGPKMLELARWVVTEERKKLRKAAKKRPGVTICAGILAAGEIRYPSRAQPGLLPRALLDLNGEMIIERLVRQLRAVGVRPVIAVGEVGRGGWTEEHVERFRELECPLLTSIKMKPSYFMGTTRVLLEHFVAQRRAYGIRPKDKIILIPGDFVFTDDTLRQTLGYPAPCLYCHNNTDPGLLLNGRTLSPVLELAAKYEDFNWKKRWFEFAGLWKKEKHRLKGLGFRYIGRLRSPTVNDPYRFVEVDVPENLEMAKMLVARERE